MAGGGNGGTGGEGGGGTAGAFGSTPGGSQGDPGAFGGIPGDEPGGLGIGPSDTGRNKPIAPSLNTAADEAAKKKKLEDEAAKKKKADDEKAKKEKDRRNRSLLTGYEDPNINKRRLIPSLLEGSDPLGSSTGDQIV